ncbi:MAG: hypothetical protein COA44_15760 [Arcobacter sp.]|nr:MAG: hypothetical protein COA44_15760 [Arcobacter sp.]
MDGQVEVSFTILCENDFSKEITLSDLLKSEKVLKAIKSDFCEGARNLVISSSASDVKISINSEKKEHVHVIEKDDIQDILELTEEYARSEKLLKGDCSRIELKNFSTLES